jgi:hypothetical protein
MIWKHWLLLCRHEREKRKSSLYFSLFEESFTKYLHEPKLRVFPLFGEALENWGKPATLLSSLLRRGQGNANNAAAAAAGWTRHYVHQ